MMSNTKIDKAKGKLKEAAGSVTGNEKLKREGQAEQIVADVKDTVSNVVDKAKDLLKGK
jgi:uncharacterized protein YjbJ (UPF0337 family)